MDTNESLSHSKWECKYHVVFMPKCHRRIIELFPVTVYKNQLDRLVLSYWQMLFPQNFCKIVIYLTDLIYITLGANLLYRQLPSHFGEVFRKLAAQKVCRIEDEHLISNRVLMLITIPPKYAVSQVAGFIKGKSAIRLVPV